MPSVAWSTPALDDLRAIDDWLTREASFTFAAQTLTAIRVRAKFLDDFPQGGRLHRSGTRILRVVGTPYLIRYRLVDDAVQILRLYHERQDWFIEP